MWQSPLHVVEAQSQRLLGPDVSVFTRPPIPACVLHWHTCSLAKTAHFVKYSASHWLQTPFHKHTHVHTHPPRVDLPVNTTVQPRRLDWPIHLLWGAVMSRSSPFGPTWQREITSKHCIDFLPRLHLPIALPWKWLTQSALMRSDG